MGWKIAGIVLILVGVILITLMAVWNVNEVKTVDISGVKADRLVAAASLIKPDFENASVAGFCGKSYELVLVGVENREIGEVAYLGLAEGKYYKATENFSLGVLQKVNEVKIDNETLVIVCGKNVGMTVFFSIWSFILFVVIGGVCFAKGCE